MKLSEHFYNESSIILNSNNLLQQKYVDLIECLKSITENEIIEFKNGKFSRDLSISKALNYIISYKLKGIGYDTDVSILTSTDPKKKWAIKYCGNGLMINVCFKHNLNTTHELFKLELGALEKVNNKLIDCNIGILITLTEKLKLDGGFDHSVATYELINNEIEYYNKIIKVPFVIIALDELDSFEINIINENGGKKSYVNEY